MRSGVELRLRAFDTTSPESSIKKIELLTRVSAGFLHYFVSCMCYIYIGVTPMTSGSQRTKNFEDWFTRSKVMNFSNLTQKFQCCALHCCFLPLFTHNNASYGLHN